MKLNNPRHPLWGCIRWVVVVVVAGVGFWIVCWRNAEHFDETEIHALKEFVLAIGGAEALRQAWYWWNSEPEKPEDSKPGKPSD